MRINSIYVILVQTGISVFNNQMRFRTFFFTLKLMKKNSGLPLPKRLRAGRNDDIIECSNHKKCKITSIQTFPHGGRL